MADNITWFDRNIGFPVADAANWLVDDALGVTRGVNTLEYALTESRRETNEAVSRKSIEENVIIPAARFANSFIESHTNISPRKLFLAQESFDESARETDAVLNEYSQEARSIAFNYVVKPAAQISLGLLAAILSPFNCIQRYDDFGGASEEEINFLGQDIYDFTSHADGNNYFDNQGKSENKEKQYDEMSDKANDVSVDIYNIVNLEDISKNDSNDVIPQEDVNEMNLDLQSKESAETDMSVPLNQSPVLDPIQNYEIVIGQKLFFKIKATDPDGNGIVYSATGLPVGASFDEESGEFLWKPILGQEGEYEIKFCASDGIVQVCQNPKINVKPEIYLDIISKAIDNGPLNDDCRRPTININGDFIAYECEASNIVANDLNDKTADIFLYNFKTAQTKLISHNLDGVSANGSSFSPSISANGDYIAFWSEATDLAVSSNGKSGIFVYDRLNDSIEWLSAIPKQEIMLSPDGQIIAFTSADSLCNYSDSNEKTDAFLINRNNKNITCVNVNKQGIVDYSGSNYPIVDYTANLVAFSSSYVFLKNMSNGQLDLISTSKSGGYPELIGNTFSKPWNMSWDGCFILYGSRFPDIVYDDTNEDNDLFVKDCVSNKNEKVSFGIDDANVYGVGEGVVSNDGRFVVYWAQDDTGGGKLFVRDRLNEETKLIDVGNTAIEPAFSGDGKILVYAKTHQYQGVWNSLIVSVSMDSLFNL